MRRRRLPAGARVSSFTGLSLRSLRARPLRSVLSAAAIVLVVAHSVAGVQVHTREVEADVPPPRVHLLQKGSLRRAVALAEAR